MPHIIMNFFERIKIDDNKIIGLMSEIHGNKMKLTQVIAVIIIYNPVRLFMRFIELLYNYAFFQKVRKSQN